MVPVSAKKKQNLDQLLEMILLSSDILELKANPKRNASGTVLEAKLDRGRGAVGAAVPLDVSVESTRAVDMFLKLDGIKAGAVTLEAYAPGVGRGRAPVTMPADSSTCTSHPAAASPATRVTASSSTGT